MWEKQEVGKAGLSTAGGGNILSLLPVEIKVSADA